MRNSPPGTHTMPLGPFTPSPSTTIGAFRAAAAGPVKAVAAKYPAIEATPANTATAIQMRPLTAARPAGPGDGGSAAFLGRATGGTFAVLRLRRLIFSQTKNTSSAPTGVRNIARESNAG